MAIMDNLLQDARIFTSIMLWALAHSPQLADTCIYTCAFTCTGLSGLYKCWLIASMQCTCTCGFRNTSTEVWKVPRCTLPEEFSIQSCDSSSASSAVHVCHCTPGTVMRIIALHCAEYWQTIVTSCSDTRGPNGRPLLHTHSLNYSLRDRTKRE